jgi:hypothetical protein
MREDDTEARYLDTPPEDWTRKVLSFTAGEREAYKALRTDTGRPVACAA